VQIHSHLCTGVNSWLNNNNVEQFPEIVIKAQSSKVKGVGIISSDCHTSIQQRSGQVELIVTG